VYNWDNGGSKTFTVILTVTDDRGGSAVASQAITVSGAEENQAPTADFTYSPTSPLKGETIHFNGSLSSDPDGTIVSWDWDFGDGTADTGEKVDHAYNWNGTGSKTFTVVLTVTDNQGASAITSKTVTVTGEEENQSPSANFTYSPTNPQKGETIYFNGGLSTDPDGTIVSWQWNFGDGNTASGLNVSHAYTWTEPGNKTFVVELKVTDNDGAQDSIFINITVVE
jgi:PKD repeat protein